MIQKSHDDSWADSCPLRDTSDVPPLPFEAYNHEPSQLQCEATTLVSNTQTQKKVRPVPPPLSETDLSPGAAPPSVPMWTPNVGGNADGALPEAPCWTPTVATPAQATAPASTMEMAIAAPAVPCPPMPVAAPINPYPQEQYDPYAPRSQELIMGSNVAPYGMMAPAPQIAPAPPIIAWYRVAFAGGVALRSGPSVDSARNGGMLYQNETFAVSETLNGLDSRVYLLLADGRGWAFDDSALMPHDPSVIRGRWQPAPVVPDPSAMTYQAMPYAAPPAWQQPVCQEAYEDEATKKRRRRKRGGVKRNKNKRAQEGYGDQPLSEADTDEPREASLEGDSLNSEAEVEVTA
eukprot:gnl/MRDRNA2_/MRDRNA2_92530_c0_seq1.p1 gnl/MRDRNA2_/MRDRNA2_92530_c0~~gnl/MRDRNA2_/MRDRNA2_92530_c0_seq1.p1  ORF type:complete len:391 (-),score=71.65 gnl/MRDRNA2_/MRDRNA2_92530_c0_seq1:359-1402(-)